MISKSFKTNSVFPQEALNRKSNFLTGGFAV